MRRFKRTLLNRCTRSRIFFINDYCGYACDTSHNALYRAPCNITMCLVMWLLLVNVFWLRVELNMLDHHVESIARGRSQRARHEA